MAPKSTRSRIESSRQSTAKPIVSPRAEARSRTSSAKRAAKSTKTAAGSVAKTAANKSKSTVNKSNSPANKSTPAAAGAKAGTATLLRSEVAYQGKVISVYKDTIVEPGGRENTREVVRHSGSVVVLAADETTDPDDPVIILIRQYRHAAGQFLIELPAGRIDAGEAPLQAAKREMIEETGFRARRWALLVKYFASPGFLGEWMQIYVARDLRPGEATPEEDEQIEMLPTPLSQAMKMVAEGRIHDGKTLIGLSLYDAARRRGDL
ncbi:MAG: NUDIX hydrolase [Acidobacteriota bacterium]|nr:NUDIX hydrolase [Acidobacteriota bacterium]